MEAAIFKMEDARDKQKKQNGGCNSHVAAAIFKMEDAINLTFRMNKLVNHFFIRLLSERGLC